jgi:hypothetical protein
MLQREAFALVERVADCRSAVDHAIKFVPPGFRMWLHGA